VTWKALHIRDMIRPSFSEIEPSSLVGGSLCRLLLLLFLEERTARLLLSGRTPIIGVVIRHVLEALHVVAEVIPVAASKANSRIRNLTSLAHIVLGLVRHCSLILTYVPRNRRPVG